MKRRTLTRTLLIAAMAIGSAVYAEEKQQTKKQTTCPVMGGKINKAQYVDVKGCRIYVCCPGCKDKIQTNPDQYIEKLKAEGIEPEKSPKKKDAENKEHHDHSNHQH